MGVTVLKRKARGFFKTEDLPIVQQAVYDVHDIITNASILLRSYLISIFGNGDEFKVDEDIIKVACSIVQGYSTLPTKKNKKNGPTDTQNLDAKRKHFDAMKSLNDDLYAKTLIKKSDLSLSQILAYSITTLLTAYENNVSSHFLKYPKRFIRCDLISKNVKVGDASKIAAVIVNYYFYEQTPTNLIVPENIVSFLDKYDPDRIYQTLFPSFVTEGEESKPRCYELKIDCWRYLKMMIDINIKLENQFPNLEEKYRKLYNPLPFHSSFVPMCIRLDTSGISQLLMNVNRIKEFKTFYKINTGITYDLNITNKGDLLGSYQKIHGKPASKYEEGKYATEMWSFMTNLKTCKQWGEIDKVSIKGAKMVFDNSIVTNGKVICIQMIDDASSGRKTKFKKKDTEDNCGKKNKKEIKKDKKNEDFLNISEDEKALSCDPGKNDIAAITDGIKSIRYTSKQRDHDTYRKALEKQSNKLRAKNGLEQYETEEMSKYCSKSCTLDIYSKYVMKRFAQKDLFEGTYRKAFFRESNFTRYCKRKSSEHKFVNRIIKTFTPSNAEADSLSYKAVSSTMRENAKKNNCKLVIGWGNWGQHPNTLKGCQPTPGIGIRRRFENHFRICTIDERGSSQGCPCCKSKTMEKFKHGDNEIHHLLRCSNDTCKSRFWNRNVLGSFNILDRFLEGRLMDESNLNQQQSPICCLNLQVG